MCGHRRDRVMAEAGEAEERVDRDHEKPGESVSADQQPVPDDANGAYRQPRAVDVRAGPPERKIRIRGKKLGVVTEVEEVGGRVGKQAPEQRVASHQPAKTSVAPTAGSAGPIARR